MPIRPRAHIIEDLSRSRICDVIAREMGWVVESLHKDYGEDLFVRIFKDGRATPLSFFIQAKSSDEVVGRAGGKWMSVRVKTEHLRHWMDFWEPLFIVLHDAKTDGLYWESVHYFLETEAGRKCLRVRSKTATVRIPLMNRLDKEGLRRMLVITKNRSRRHANEAEGAQVLLDMLHAVGVEISDYNPSREMVIRKEPDGGLFIVAFGKTAELIRAEGKGDDPDFFNEAVRSSIEELDRVTKGRKVKLSDLDEEEKGDIYMFDKGSDRSRVFWETWDVDELIAAARKRRRSGARTSIGGGNVAKKALRRRS
ncbi:DUF4365 domain-containing protein [Corallococcus sp. 4LFB]|uniref:DUF4365 domain-containing protein n=1 Tax=Corallococcus sp. 4LFB TaxID=3383249 RepID=UPI003975B552